MTDALIELYGDYRRSGPNGYAAQISPTVSELTGAPARTLDQALAAPQERLVAWAGFGSCKRALPVRVDGTVLVRRLGTAGGDEALEEVTRTDPKCDTRHVPDLLTGTVTFLLADLEGSTGVGEEHPR